MKRLIDIITHAFATDFRIRKRMHLDWDMWDNTRILPEPMPYYVLQYRLLPGVWITIQAFADDEPWVAEAQAEEALHYLTINN